MLRIYCFSLWSRVRLIPQSNEITANLTFTATGFELHPLCSMQLTVSEEEKKKDFIKGK